MSEDGTTDGEDDWFEQALQEDDDGSDDWAEFEAEAEGDEEPTGGDAAEGGDATTGEQSDAGDDSVESDPWETVSADTTGGQGDQAAADDPSASSDWTEGVETDDEPTDWTETVDTEDDSETAGEPETDAVEEESPFSTGSSSSADGDDGLFDEGFGDAFGGSGDEGDFADEDFDSDIPRLDIGIEGLDEMIQGGIPRKHLIVVIGSAGTGKTTFGLQFLNHGLQHDENSVFITLEQSREAIISTGNERGWAFDEYEEEGKLAIVDLDPVEMANSLDNIQAELPQLIKDFGADRLVLDSVSLLEMMYDDQAKRRTEVFDFTRSLKKAGVTTFLTSEASETNPYASRHGIIEYLTDAVFVLQYVRGETQETRLAVEIQKIRNSNHSREKKPYEMTDEGISVYQQANIF